MKAAVITSNAGRYQISAQCRMLGVPKPTYYAMRNRAEAEPESDPPDRRRRRRAPRQPRALRGEEDQAGPR